MAEVNSTSVKPYLIVNNGKQAVEFYVSAFGAIETKRFEMPNQKLSSVIEIDKAEFFIGDEEPENENVGSDLNFNGSVRIILQTKNADQLFEEAIKLGAIQICPMTTEDNWRIGKLKDPFGHIWEIGYTL